MSSISSKLSQRALSWITEQPDAIALLIMLLNNNHNWFSFEDQAFILKELGKKKTEQFIKLMVRNIPAGKSLCPQAELLIFCISNKALRKELWDLYRQKAGSIQPKTKWIAQRKGWL